MTKINHAHRTDLWCGNNLRLWGHNLGKFLISTALEW